MFPFFAMVRKQLMESRWLLAMLAAALFGLGWLSVYVTARIERRMAQIDDAAGGFRRMAFMRALGGSAMDFSSGAIEVMLWNHPAILLTVALWAISRASGAPAGEVEKGTLDLTLSRPVSRASYLGSQVFVALLGLLILSGALVAGNRVGSQFNVVQAPPRLMVLVKPAINLAAIGLAIYGYTLLLSSIDSVRWRPNLIGSMITLASFILLVIVNLPSMEDWKGLERFSIFKAYQPVEVAVKGETFAFNVAVLAGIGCAGIVLSFLAFQRRNLPSNS
jgi:beta-exotoxin I transport system permease protein